MLLDKNWKEIVCQDYEANIGVGVEIGQTGHKLWVCIDGICVLRIRSPKIILTDFREIEAEQINKKQSAQKEFDFLRSLLPK